MMTKLMPTIGLEIHVQLSTKTKMFCNSPNVSRERRPNVNVCPVCMGHPGTLPTINRQAILSVLQVGKVVLGDVADYSEFDRKNYFYPDIPKGYQISQYAYPLVSGGELSGVQITRIHLEEDTARSIHDEQGHSLVDFNRAGAPLMELVTEPVIHTAEVAATFAKELQLLLRALNVSGANMERGEMRVEANVSVSESDARGVKTEIKNLNSFKSVERAIAFEVERQSSVIQSGGKVIQETRGWDETKQVTFAQRLKETSEDYRYFPDPDLPKLVISQFLVDAGDSNMQEAHDLPEEVRERYRSEYGLKDEDIEMYVRSAWLKDMFEEAVKAAQSSKNKLIKVSNYITSNIVGLANDQSLTKSDVMITGADLVTIVDLVEAGELSSRGARVLIEAKICSNQPIQDIIDALDLKQNSNLLELKIIVKKLIEENPRAISEYKAGKDSALNYLVGAGMKATQGKANPEILASLLREVIAE